MAWRKVKPKKKTLTPEVLIPRPPRMKITPEESLRRMQTFKSERIEQFIDAVQNSKTASG